MKPTIAFLILSIAPVVARADITFQQKIDSDAIKGTMTLKMKGDKMRVDMPAGPMGSVSMIMDTRTGEAIALVAEQKMAIKMSAEQTKAMGEMVSKQMANEMPKTKPKDTGKSEKVGAYDTEIYTWSGAEGTSQTFWVAKDFPGYREIKAQFDKLTNSPLAAMTKDVWSSMNDLPGMVVKSDGTMAGQKIVTELISAKETPVDASDFEAPKDYQVATQPAVTPEAQESEEKANKIQASLVEGAAFPAFDEKDASGNPLSLAAFGGKTVLVDFWATWCGPCRGEVPNVVATYKKYHSKGFEIVGVSLDQDKQKMLDYTSQQGMVWRQFFDGQGWKNKLAVQYGVQSIPATFLLDGKGKIIGKDLRGEALTAAVGKAVEGN